MRKIKSLPTIVVSAALGAATIFTVSATNAAEAYDRYSNYGRQIVGGVYYNAGNRVCGPSCGMVSRQAGQRIYDSSRRFSTQYGERLQRAGSRLRR